MEYSDIKPSPGLQRVLTDRKERETLDAFAEISNDKVSRCFPLNTGIDVKSFRLGLPDNSEHVQDITRCCKTLQPGLDCESCSWDDVHESIQEAILQYERKAQGSRIRSTLRNGKHTAASLRFLSEMLPDEKGLSVLRVGLVAIFRAWRERIDNVEKILLALGDLPVVFSAAAETYALFLEPGDLELRTALQNLESIVLQGIADLVRVLLRKGGETSGDTNKNFPKLPRLKNLVKQNSGTEADEIDDVLHRVSRAKDRVNSRVETLDRRRAKETNRASVKASIEITETRKAVHVAQYDILETMQYQHHGNMSQFDIVRDSIQTGVDATKSLTSKVENDMMWIKECSERSERFNEYLMQHIMQSDNAARTFATSLWHFIADIVLKQRLREEEQRFLHPSQDRPLIMPSQLINMVDVPEFSHLQDLEEVVRQEHTMNADVLGRGQYLLAMVGFQDFLTKMSSQILLVDGHCGRLSTRKISPVSILCASLAACLKQNPRYVVLHFFCGQHCDPQDRLSGPQGLMRSFIHQMLVYPRLVDQDLRLASPKLSDRPSLTSLFDIFTQIYQCYSRDRTVFCIIDGVSDFETTLWDWLPQMIQVVKFLQSVIARSSHGFCIKLLMTSADKSTNISQMIKPSDRLELRAGRVYSSNRAKEAMLQAVMGST